MNVLIVHAHPVGESFSRAIVLRAVASLQQAGHSTTVLDLDALNYSAAMSADELAAYSTDSPTLDPMVADHVRLLTECSALIFVYPTWWSSMPAIMKGWIDRTMLMGVAFSLDEKTGHIRPELTNVKRLIGISTYGASRLKVRIINDNGRRVITRSVRATCNRFCRTSWIALHKINLSTPQQREEFFQRVDLTMKKL